MEPPHGGQGGKMKNYYFVLLDGIPAYWDALGPYDKTAQLCHSSKYTPTSMASLKTVKRWIEKTILFRKGQGWDYGPFEISRAITKRAK
jgi:hypothetical protein